MSQSSAAFSILRIKTKMLLMASRVGATYWPLPVYFHPVPHPPVLATLALRAFPGHTVSPLGSSAQASPRLSPSTAFPPRQPPSLRFLMPPGTQRRSGFIPMLSLVSPSRPGFCSLGISDILGSVTVRHGGCPVYCGVPSSIPGLCHQMPVAPLPPVMTTKNVPDMAKCPLLEKITQVEHSCSGPVGGSMRAAGPVLPRSWLAPGLLGM